MPMKKQVLNLFAFARKGQRKVAIVTIPCILLILLFTAVSCEKPEQIVSSDQTTAPTSQDSIFNMKCYVIGCDGCSPSSIEGNHIKWKGYLLVSENLQDTLRTYTLPDTIFNFPVGCEEVGYTGFIYFKSQYRYTYFMNISYKFLPQNEHEGYACLAYLPMHSFGPAAMRQIKILSCEKLYQK
jgi:hypothetical protein